MKKKMKIHEHCRSNFWERERERERETETERQRERERTQSVSTTFFVNFPTMFRAGAWLRLQML
jgi:hypothetical protein